MRALALDWRRCIRYLPLAALITWQAVAWTSWLKREVVWAYAIGDQGPHLTRAYAIHERIERHGLANGIRHGLSLPLPSGSLLPTEAAVLFQVLGASRLSALSVNLIHLFLFEAVLLLALSSRTNISVGYGALGLYLTAGAPHEFPGGLWDFRFDFAAQCLYGVFVCSAMASDGFRRRGWSLFAGLAGLACISTRHVTVVYVLSVLAAATAVLCWRLRSADVPVRVAARSTLGNVAVCAGVVSLALPLLIARAQVLERRYGPTTLGFQEARGRLAAGATHYTYYVDSLLAAHGGTTFSLVALGVIAAGFGLRRAYSTPKNGFVGVLLWSSFLVPLAALTLYPVRAQHVGGILVPPAVALVASFVARSLPQDEPGKPGRARYLTLASLGGTIVLGIGIATTAVRMRENAPFTSTRQRVTAYLDIYDAIYRFAEHHPAGPIRMFSEYWPQYLREGAVRATLFERHGRAVRLMADNFYMNGQKAEGILEAVAASDLLIMGGPLLGITPFEREIQRLHLDLEAISRRDFHVLGQWVVDGLELRLHGRNTPRGVSDRVGSLGGGR